MRRWFLHLLFILSILTSLLFLDRIPVALAARGIPGSAEFGYGGVLYPQGIHLEQALQVAGDLQFDWLLVPVNWSDYYPAPDAQPDFSALDRVVTFASQNQLSLLFSLSGAPEWALTSQGPEPSQTISFVRLLLQRYPGAVSAFEIFPGANTVQGWGAIPNPGAYATLFVSLCKAVQEQGSSILLVAGGLEPVGGVSSNGDMNDVAFLQGLYTSGLKEWMPVISVRLSSVTGDALQSPSPAEQRVLRHYEEIRQVMLSYQHDSGLLWVTALSSPAELARQSQDAQSAWLSQAYQLLRAQLYIGVAFLESINPDNWQTNQPNFSLVVDNQNYHLFYAKLRSLIAENSPDVIRYKRGRPKIEGIIKA